MCHLTGKFEFVRNRLLSLTHADFKYPFNVTVFIYKKPGEKYGELHDSDFALAYTAGFKKKKKKEKKKKKKLKKKKKKKKKKQK